MYLVNGVANNELKNAEQAVEILEMGLDYLFDDPKMEYDFYQQLSIALHFKREVCKKGQHVSEKKQLSYLLPTKKRWMIKISKREYQTGVSYC